jgi:hypothetical protein
MRMVRMKAIYLVSHDGEVGERRRRTTKKRRKEERKYLKGFQLRQVRWRYEVVPA